MLRTRSAAALALALSSIFPAVAVAGAEAAVRGCDRPAGSPEQAAALQYCPRETPAKRTERPGALPGAPVGTADEGAPPRASAAANQKVSVDDSSVPFTGYPGSDGVNAIVWILLALLALLGARALHRRYGGGKGSGGSGDRLRELGSRLRSGASG